MAMGGKIKIQTEGQSSVVPEKNKKMKQAPKALAGRTGNFLRDTFVARIRTSESMHKTASVKIIMALAKSLPNRKILRITSGIMAAMKK